MNVLQRLEATDYLIIGGAKDNEEIIMNDWNFKCGRLAHISTIILPFLFTAWHII